MYQIKAINQDGALIPESPLPKVAKMIICDGDNYTVYEEGDEVPEINE